MTVLYEWDVETVDEYGDILDHCHADKVEDLKRLLKDPNTRLVLVRDVVSADGDLKDRTWAYAGRGALPTKFQNGEIVPIRFHKELSKL